MPKAAAVLLFGPLFLYASALADDFSAGAKLTPAQAAAIESGKPPISLADSRRLLGYYAAYPDPPQHRDKRIALILTLAQQGALGRLAVHRAAHFRRETASYTKVKDALLARAEKTKLPIDRSNAAWFLFPEEPDEAIKITAENGLMHDTAVMAAQYLLGVVHPDGRSSPFGRGLMDLVNETPDPLFQFAFGDTLRALGAQLYAEGKTEWNYTALANESLARAAKAEPQQTNCGFEPAALPTRGAASSPPKPPADYAPLAPGEVAFHALIGCSGYAASLEWLDGPATAVSAAKREIAARQFDVQPAGGSPAQSLQLLTAGRKSR